jgi:hypothetical protein
MVSTWWLIAAFFGGGFAGVLLMALMSLSGRLPEQAQQVADLGVRPW